MSSHPLQVPIGRFRVLQSSRNFWSTSWLLGVSSIFVFTRYQNFLPCRLAHVSDHNMGVYHKIDRTKPSDIIPPPPITAPLLSTTVVVGAEVHLQYGEPYPKICRPRPYPHDKSLEKRKRRQLMMVAGLLYRRVWDDDDWIHRYSKLYIPCEFLHSVTRS
ncbi:hypothetical protein QCA50_009731 [Cerrena zonata]|uniref:Uncharacterized protein n=1 Tax=Cerrena zonata TaxID=2478898 RepID=A0AAW0GC92_9APHY